MQETLERGLHDMTDVEMVLMEGFLQFFLIVIGNAAYEMYGECLCLFAPRRGEKVAQDELAEAVDEEGVDGWVFPMARTEGAEGGEVTVG